MLQARRKNARPIPPFGLVLDLPFFFFGWFLDLFYLLIFCILVRL